MLLKGAKDKLKVTPSLRPIEGVAQASSSQPGDMSSQTLQAKEVLTLIREYPARETILSQALRRANLAIKDDCMLHFQVGTSLERNALQQEKIALQAYLKKCLQMNVLIEVAQKERADDDTTKMPYTHREKYEYLVKKHPMIEELKKQLGLEVR